jgi:hypothetical protein
LQVLLLELNEVNFDYLRALAAHGGAPNLARIIQSHGIAETISEQSYDELEPWIQWVTAHTGLPFKDHGIFRLGDMVNSEIGQIWEHLERHGLRVAAMSPMNATNRTRNPAYFIPDPWTPTTVSAKPLLEGVYRAVARAVNDNARARISPGALAWLLAGAARYARPCNYAIYTALATTARAKPWVKSMILDLLLTDIFVRETRRTKPNFASLFLNAAAHIQHHYMFNFFAYKGEKRNPDWYVPRGADPVADVYRLYDRIVGQVQRAFPAARIMIATGLHQDPHSETTFYWRLKDHPAFLQKLGVPFRQVGTRMSRDFLIECESEHDASTAERILQSANHEGEPLFAVDNRGRDLFVMLTWPRDIGPDFVYSIGDRRIEGLRNDVAFVAIKNGQHNGTGYFIDTGTRPERLCSPFPLADLPATVCKALGVDWPRRVADAQVVEGA